MRQMFTAERVGRIIASSTCWWCGGDKREGQPFCFECWTDIPNMAKLPIMKLASHGSYDDGARARAYSAAVKVLADRNEHHMATLDFIAQAKQEAAQ